jgi:hypothetical protein
MEIMNAMESGGEWFEEIYPVYKLLTFLLGWAFEIIDDSFI